FYKIFSLLIQNSTFKIHNFIKFSLRLSKHIHFVKRYGINYKFIVSYSFYDSNKTKKEVEKAYVSYEMEKERLERQKEDIENEISLIHNEKSSLKHRLKNLEINLELAHKTLQMNQKKYELGKISSREVMESQLSYRNLKSSYEDVNIDFIINQLRLLKAMGISLECYILKSL
ncbi:MAG: TolC family protein, partial [bacterium]